MMSAPPSHWKVCVTGRGGGGDERVADCKCLEYTQVHSSHINKDYTIQKILKKNLFQDCIFIDILQ